MKISHLLFGALAFASTAAFAQVSTHTFQPPVGGAAKSQLNPSDKAALLNRTLPTVSGEDRSVSADFYLDYSIVDAEYGLSIGATADISGWDINRNFGLDTSNLFQLRWAAVFYDEMIDFTSNPTYPFNHYPTSAVNPLTVDSLFFVIGHINGSATTNKIKATIYDGASLPASPPYLSTTGVLGTPIWSDSIEIDTSFTGPGATPGTINLGTLTFLPGVVISSGEGFVVQLDFWGDEDLDELLLVSGFNNLGCDATYGTLLSIPTVVGSRLNGTTPPNWNSPGIWIVPGSSAATATLSSNYGWGIDVNANGDFDVAECEWVSMQNWIWQAAVSSTVAFSANAGTTDLSGLPTNEGCAGDLLNINMDVYGAAGPLTYSWSPATGLSSTSIEDPTVTVGTTDVTYSCTVSDGTSSYVVTVDINSNGVDVSLGTDKLIDCGNTTPLIASPSGTLTGLSYVWNDGVTTSNAITGAIAGTYQVTVTNSFGCSATDQVNVSYNGVSNNTVEFNPTNPPLCAGAPGEDFTNLTSRQGTGWSWTWHYTEGAIDYYAATGHFNLIAGTATLNLTADSAGCKYFKSHAYTVLSASDPSCGVGFEDFDFSSNIELFPNPTNGTFELVVEGVTSDLNVSVYTLDGAQILNDINSANGTLSKSYDLSKLAAGVYVVKIQSGDRVAVRKLVLDK